MLVRGASVAAAVVLGMLLSFSVLGLVAVLSASPDFSAIDETESGVHDLIILVKEPGFYHVRVWRGGDGWKARVFRMEEDREIPFDDGELLPESSI